MFTPKVLHISKHVIENAHPGICQAVDTMNGLYKMFLGVDATQVEINPLGMTKEGKGV